MLLGRDQTRKSLTGDYLSLIAYELWPQRRLLAEEYVRSIPLECPTAEVEDSTITGD